MLGGNPCHKIVQTLELHISFQSDIDSSQLKLLSCPRSVAAWCDAPDTQFLLDFIRPDFLLLRVSSVTVMCAAGQVQCLAMSSKFFNFFCKAEQF